MATRSLFRDLLPFGRDVKREKYLAQRNAIDMLELNLKIDEATERKERYDVGEKREKARFEEFEEGTHLDEIKNRFAPIIATLSDANILKTELPDIKKSINAIMSDKKDNMSVEIKAGYDYHKNIADEMIENIQDIHLSRTNAFTTIDEINDLTRLIKNVGKYNTDASGKIVENAMAKQEYYTKEGNADMMEFYGEAIKTGTGMNFVLRQLAKYPSDYSWKDTEISQKATVEAARDAYQAKDWGLAYQHLSGMPGAAKADEKLGMKSQTELQEMISENIRRAIKQNMNIGVKTASKETTGKYWGTIEAFTSYGTGKEDHILSLRELRRNFSRMLKRIDDEDAWEGNVRGDVKKDFEGQADEFIMSAAHLAGDISKTPDGDYIYADMKPFMIDGEVIKGMELGTHIMGDSEEIQKQRNLNISKLKYDLQEKNDMDLLQLIHANAGQTILDTDTKYQERRLKALSTETAKDVETYDIDEVDKTFQTKLAKNKFGYKTASRQIRELEAKDRRLLAQLKAVTLPSGKLGSSKSDEYLRTLPQFKDEFAQISDDIAKWKNQMIKHRKALGLDFNQKDFEEIPWYYQSEAQAIVDSALNK